MVKLQILVIFILIQLFSNAYAGPFGKGPPFAVDIIMGNVGKERVVSENQIFAFDICLYADEGNLNDTKMSITLPSAVEKWIGESEWNGVVVQGQKKCLLLGLKSHANIRNWNNNISAHIEFVHEGLKYKRDVNWGPHGFKDTGFVQFK